MADHSMACDADTIIIGAGVVGLSVARALCHAGQDVLVLDRNERMGSETSSRNSEVIHAGIYYPAGSLKARLCVRGKDLLYRFAADHGVTVDRCGKIIVAAQDEEVAALATLSERARAAGVDDLCVLDAKDLQAVEPAVHGVRALLSPSTGVIDSHGLLSALAGDIQAHGGEIVLRSEVVDIHRAPADRLRLSVASGAAVTTLTCRRLVNAAGLLAPEVTRVLARNVRVREGFALDTPHYSKGHYFSLRGPCPFRHLIYPVPSETGLGIHLTRDVWGAVKFGPDHAWIDRIDYSFEDDGGTRTRAFETAIRRYWPDLPDDALLPAYTGIRPRIFGPKEQPADFKILGPETHGVAGYIALHGIESPGLTAALAIGEMVTQTCRPRSEER